MIFRKLVPPLMTGMSLRQKHERMLQRVNK
jgi:hypothetical protein